MARTIKQVAHDLTPMLKLMDEIGEQFIVLLPELQKKCGATDSQVKEYFENAVEGMQNMHGCAQLIKHYVKEVEQEAEIEGIPKGY